MTGVSDDMKMTMCAALTDVALLLLLLCCEKAVGGVITEMLIVIAP